MSGPFHYVYAETMMPSRIAILIDNAYFQSIMRDEFGSPRIDYGALAQKVAGGSYILRSYVYDCPTYQGTTPTDEESERYARQRKFFQALERLPRFTVRLGKLARRGPDAQGRYRFEQKRVDSLLSVDLTMLAAKHLIQEAAIIAGDSDFIPAVEAAKSEGVLIRLFHGQSVHSDLWTVADERVQFSQEFIDSIRLSA